MKNEQSGHTDLESILLEEFEIVFHVEIPAISSERRIREIIDRVGRVVSSKRQWKKKKSKNYLPGQNCNNFLKEEFENYVKE